MSEGGEPATEDLYAVLGVSRDASSGEIRDAYRLLVAEIATGRMPISGQRQIEEAFETLADPIARLRYDRRVRSSQPARISRFPVDTSRSRGGPPHAEPPRRRSALLPDVHPSLGTIAALVVFAALGALLSPVLRRVPPATLQRSGALSIATPAGLTPESSSPTVTAPSALNQTAPSLGSLIAVADSNPSLLAPPPMATEPPFVSRGAAPSAAIAVVAAAAVANQPVVRASPPAVAVTAPASAQPTSPVVATANLPIPAAGTPEIAAPVRPLVTATVAPNRIFVPNAPVAQPPGEGDRQAQP
jgi:hypothetical protein